MSLESWNKSRGSNTCIAGVYLDNKPLTIDGVLFGITIVGPTLIPLVYFYIFESE